MDILIIGGLLVIGIAAIVALFFVLRSGDNTPRTRAPQAVPQTAREAPPTPAYEPPAPQPEQVQNVTSQTQDVTPVSEERTVPIAEVVPQDRAVHTQPITENEQPLRVHLNGQFHELASGLRSLQQQATEMEQRLSSLNQLIDGIERNPTEDK